MANNDDRTPDSAFSWLKVWTTPLGMFIVVVSISLGLILYGFISDRQQTIERRAAFCQSEIGSNRRQRLLWETIIQFSNEDKTSKEIEADKPQTERFRKFIRETFPVGGCELAPDSVPKPTQEPQ